MNYVLVKRGVSMIRAFCISIMRVVTVFDVTKIRLKHSTLLIFT